MIFVFFFLGCVNLVWALLDTTQWCKYLRDTEEPALLIYNRIPKCGSSTLLELLSHLHNLHLENFNEEYWGDYVKNVPRMDALHKLFKKHRQASREKASVIVGHISYRTIFSALEGIVQQPVEYMQIFRECEPRFHSHWLYNFNYSVHAVQARQTGRLLEWHQQCTGTKHPYHCVTNLTCMTNAPLTAAIQTNVINFYVRESSNGVRGHQRQNYANLVQKIRNQANFIPNRNSYVTFGLVEHLQEYLEMLECAYPTLFAGNNACPCVYVYTHIYMRAYVCMVLIHSYPCAGVLERYTRQHGIVVNGHSATSLPPKMETSLRKLAHDVCNASTSTDGVLYESFLAPTFWARYRAMKKDPEKCCRRSHVTREGVSANHN